MPIPNAVELGFSMVPSSVVISDLLALESESINLPPRDNPSVKYQSNPN